MFSRQFRPFLEKKHIFSIALYYLPKISIIGLWVIHFLPVLF